MGRSNRSFKDTIWCS